MCVAPPQWQIGAFDERCEFLLAHAGHDFIGQGFYAEVGQSAADARPIEFLVCLDQPHGIIGAIEIDELEA